jgi:hypothetical protein
MRHLQELNSGSRGQDVFPVAVFDDMMFANPPSSLGAAFPQQNLELRAPKTRKFHLHRKMLPTANAKRRRE